MIGSKTAPVTLDPSGRMVRCTDCGQLVPLDSLGRFLTHLPAAQAKGRPPRWCPASGREMGRITVNREKRHG